MSVADGVTVSACTPHIMPGYYDNAGPDIREAIIKLQHELDNAGIALRLVTGADVHLVTDIVSGLRSGRILSLNDSRYFLFEPPHHVAPPRLEEAVFDVMTAGYQPLITHPERLSWIESHYEIMVRMAHAGAWMQITAGSVTGRFGKRPQYWAERMVDEGIVHVLASDAHNLRNRAPGLSKARDAIAERLGEAAANDMVLTRPRAVIENAAPESVPPAVGAVNEAQKSPSLLRRLFKAA